MSVIWILGFLFIPILYFTIIMFAIVLIFSKMVKTEKDQEGNITGPNIIKRLVGIILILILVVMYIYQFRIEDDSKKSNFIDGEKLRLEQEELKEKEYKIKKNEIEEEVNDLIDNNFIFADIKLGDVSGKVCEVVNIKLLISNNNMPKDEMKFAEELVKSYKNIKAALEKYNYDSEVISIEFKDGNSFAKETSTFYKDGGYIKERKDSYLIYLNPAPIEIKK